MATIFSRIITGEIPSYKVAENDQFYACLLYTSFITTNVLYKELVQEQLPELDKSQILLEPTRRSTAPCIAWASYWLLYTSQWDENIVGLLHDSIVNGDIGTGSEIFFSVSQFGTNFGHNLIEGF